MGSPTTTCFRYDEDGYYVRPSLCQIVNKVPLLAKNSTLVEPPLDLTETHFLKWDGEKQSWIPEKKPTTAAECAALGALDHESQTDRVHELRKIFEKLTEGSTEWRLVQDDETLAKMVLPIPLEEAEAAEADRELAEFDSQIASLKDRMATAMLLGDEEEAKAIRSEYLALMS